MTYKFKIQDDYIAEDKNMQGNKRHDVIEKVSHGHHNYDYYGDYGMQTSGATGNGKAKVKNTKVIKITIIYT